MHLASARARATLRTALQLIIPRPPSGVRSAMLLATLGLVSACGDGGSDSSADLTEPATGNRAPTISGSAPASVRVGEPYTFRPSASDPDGDVLHFTASSVPSWASFDGTTGRLSGTPAAGSEGSYEQIVITVSDGKASAALASFGITVVQDAAGVATLSWLPPTANADGSPLVDLAGYRIEYGRDPQDLDQNIAIDNPSINTYVVEQLSAGTWYFAIVALNAGSIESGRSNLATKTIG